MALRLFAQDEQAESLKQRFNLPVIIGGEKPAHIQEGLAIPTKPYYALWSYKVYFNDRFDLLGNCLAVLAGIASYEKSQAIMDW